MAAEHVGSSVPTHQLGDETFSPSPLRCSGTPPPVCILALTKIRFKTLFGVSNNGVFQVFGEIIEPF